MADQSIDKWNTLSMELIAVRAVSNNLFGGCAENIQLAETRGVVTYGWIRVWLSVIRAMIERGTDIEGIVFEINK